MAPWRRAGVVFAALFVLQVIFCLVLSPYGAASTDDYRDHLQRICFGATFSQPLLVAIAAALWPGRLLLALPTGMVLSGLLAHLMNFAAVNYPNRNTYGEIELPIIWVVIYVALLLPILILRRARSW